MVNIIKIVIVIGSLLVGLAACGSDKKDDSRSKSNEILQQAAQETMRYAVTGQWDENSVAEVMGYAIPENLDSAARRTLVLDQLVPCTAGFDPVFFDHWGHDCEPGDEDDQDLRRSIASLISVAARARQAAADLYPAPGVHIVGLEMNGAELNTETVGENEPGWFHVWMCSERELLDSRDQSSRYQMVGDGISRRCELTEGENKGQNQYDLGRGCDRITLVLFYNQPQENGGYVRLEASSSGQNDCMWPGRVTNLPPQLILPAFTPSPTP